MELLLSFFSSLLKEYQKRRFLQKKVHMVVNGEQVSPKQLLKLAKQAEQQAMLRQIYGLASEGGSCVVTFDDDGNATIASK